MPHIIYKSDVIDPAGRHAVAFDNLHHSRQTTDLALTALALGGHPLGEKFAQGHGAGRPELVRRWRPIAKIPFNSSHKYQAHLYNHPTAATAWAFVAGAPEVLLEKSSHAPDAEGRSAFLDHQRRHQLSQVIAALAAQYHLVGVAARRHLPTTRLTRAHVHNLTLVGLLLISEQLQTNLPAPIDKLFTGDHPATAATLARRLGLVANPDVHLSAWQLEHLDDHELTPLLPRVNIFSRLDQLHTQRLLRLYGSA